MKSSAALYLTMGLTNSNLTGNTKNNHFDVEGYSYRLPELKKGSRLLFIGDSITDMNWGRNETDRNHYLGHSYVFLIASRLGIELANLKLNFYNRGNSGDKVIDLKKRWNKDAVKMNPDVLTILVGTNDAAANVTPSQFESDYRYILEASQIANSNLKIVIMEPFILQVGHLKDDKIWKKRKELIDQYRTITTKLSEEFETVYIQTQEVFDKAAKLEKPEYWMWDGIHPLPQSHELIARNWINEVSLKWPNTK